VSDAKDLANMIEVIYREVTEDRAEITEWEDKFLNDMNGLLAFDLALSVDQEKKLVEIWKRVTGL